NDSFLAFAARAFRPLIPMTVPVLAADIGFVNFNDAHELAEVGIGKTSTNTMAHIPSSFQRTEAHITPDLPRAKIFFGSKHEMDHAEPFAKRLVRVLKNRAGDIGKPICAAFPAVWAFPMPFAGLKRINLIATAARACHAFWPAACDKIGIAGIL